MNTNLTRALALSPILAALVSPVGCTAADEPTGAQPRVGVASPYTGAPSGARSEDVGTAAEALNSGHGIGYQGGRVLSGTVDVYYIWYGNWAGNTATSILTDLAENLGGSPYFEINELYDDSSGEKVTGAVRFAGSTTDNYSQGATFSNGYNNTWAVVQSALSSGRLPVDANGVYFVLTSPDVTVPGFCTSACGWHTWNGYSGTDIQFAWIGDAATQCPGACIPGANESNSPNGNPGADGMASVVSHELEESTTDPELNAWEDSGYENADRCAWNFGSATYTTSNGATANMRLGDRDYLIQQNWLNQGSGSCGLSQTAGAYTFDEGTGTAPRSTSGSGAVGSFVGGAGWTSGIAGTAVSLNGTNAFVDTGAHVLDTSQSYTVSTWVKLNTLAGWQTFVSQDGNTVTPFYLQKRGDTNAFALNMHTSESLGIAAIADSTFVPKTGVWYNVVGVYDQPNGLAKLYVNGVLQSSVSFTGGWNAAGHTMIGRSKYNGNLVDYVNGVIDETSFYSRVLSDAEVATFYQDRAGLLLQRSSCASVHGQIPTAGDGDAVIDVGNDLVTVYCADMVSSPKEYLSLLHTGGSSNVSYYGVGPNSNGLTTSFTKVRFYPSNLTVDTTDTTFSTSTGYRSLGPNTYYSNDFADAGDCRASGSETGTANVDFTGTKFAVVTNQFAAQGWNAAGTATYSSANQVVNLTGGGYCGDMEVSPAGARLQLQ